MATQEGAPRPGISRRKFLTLAGAGAIVGAVVLAAAQKKSLQGLVKAATTNRTNQPNQATAGKYITTSATPAGPSILQRIFGGKI